MALADRLGADADLDDAFGTHLDADALVRRAHRRLDVVGKADAGEPAAACGRLAARRETVPIGHGEGARHVAGEVAGVVGESHGRAIGELLAPDHVAPAQLDPVDGKLRCRELDQPLDDQRRLRPAGAAIGRGRDRIGHRAAHAHMRRRDVVERGRDPARIVERHIGDRVRADIADMIDRERQHAARAVERELRFGHEVPPLVVGEEGFRTVARPFHRAAEAARREQHGDLLGIDIGARAEPAADIGADHPHALGRQLEALRQRRADAMHALVSGNEREQVLGRVMKADGGTRLHLRVDDALIAERPGDDAVGAFERGAHGGAVAELGLDRDVVRGGRPERGRARRERIEHIDDGRQRLVFDRHGLGRIARGPRGLGDDHGDRLAQVACAADGERHLRLVELERRIGRLAVNDGIGGVRHVGDADACPSAR